MLGSLVRHSFLAILLAVVIEELGLPSPIPTDLMIVFAGTTAGGSVLHLAMYFVALTVASAVGGSGLYVIVRRGGRPLVDRYGRYVHLGPERLARAEALLARGGWGTIALGRMIPGVRYATVIACGLLKVPFPRYFTAHVAGSSVYVAVFLTLGAFFGPAILERLHLPSEGLRLLWLLPLALGLPLLVVRWGRRVHSRQPAAPSRRRLLGAVLLGGFTGTIALTATLSVTATVADLFGASHPLNVAYSLLGWTMLGLRMKVGGTLLLLYVVLLSLLICAAAVYYELVLPYLAPRGLPPLRQVLGLALLVLGFFGIVFLSSLLVNDPGSLRLWWDAGGPIMLLGAALGVLVYASTAVYGRTLAVAMAPSLRREES
ncbi:MAG: DedA family protein [Actinobacteria bacterium]|nr:DedA family protein [Actinomycetota bacterium]